MSIKEINNEKSLLCKVAEGDQQAFTLIFDHYYTFIRDYIFKVTESREATEELVQEIFIKVWEKRATLPTINNFHSYLFILSKNQTLNHLRYLARNQSKERYWLTHHAEESYQLDSTDMQEEYHSIVNQAITSLPPQQQKVYHLSRYENLKYDEIALQLGLSKETVKKHMQYALAFLKDQVKTKAKELITSTIPIILFLF